MIFVPLLAGLGLLVAGFVAGYACAEHRHLTEVLRQADAADGADGDGWLEAHSA